PNSFFNCSRTSNPSKKASICSDASLNTVECCGCVHETTSKDCLNCSLICTLNSAATSTSFTPYCRSFFASEQTARINLHIPASSLIFVILSFSAITPPQNIVILLYSNHCHFASLI